MIYCGNQTTVEPYLQIFSNWKLKPLFDAKLFENFIVSDAR